MRERWKAIPKFEGLYEVSDQGRVRSLPRECDNGKGSYIKPGRVLVTLQHKAGYKQCTLTQDGEFTYTYVHRLVLEAFVGPCPLGKEAAHVDGDATNNVLGNLQWVTHSENEKHKIAHGRNGKKLSLAQVKVIRKQYPLMKQGHIARCYALGEQFSVSGMQIRQVVLHLAWKAV